MPTKRFVLYDASMRNPPPPVLDAHNQPIPPPPASIVAEAADEGEASSLGSSTFSGQTALTWVEYQLEADGVTRCNGKVRDDLPPHTVAP